MFAGEEEGYWEWIAKEFGMDMYTLLYLKWITNKDLLCRIWNSTQWNVAAWMRGEFGGEWIYFKAESLRCSPKTIMTLLISYTPIQNKVLKEKSVPMGIFLYMTLFFFLVPLEFSVFRSVILIKYWCEPFSSSCLGFSVLPVPCHLFPSSDLGSFQQ